jgi:hypothetical protein
MTVAIDWFFWKLRLFTAEMRYDAAIRNRQRTTNGLETSCNERFRAISAVEEQIIKHQLALTNELKVVNGALNAYVETKDEIHREVGQVALGRLHKHKATVEELKAIQEEHRNGLVELRKDYSSETGILEDLMLDKPRALADLRASGIELLTYKRITKPVKQTKTETVIRDYQSKATALRDTHRFMQEDIYASYKTWAGDSIDSEMTNSRIFDDLVQDRLSRV